MSYPHSLTSLTPREAIADALYRSLIGFDRHDIPIFESSFAGEDVSFEIHDGETRVINGLSTIRDGLLAGIGPLATTHTMSNIRIDVKDGADTASLTCTALAQHCPPGRGKELDGPKFLVGGEYRLNLIRDEIDGLWKIKKWVLDITWKEGDASILHPPS